MAFFSGSVFAAEQKTALIGTLADVSGVVEVMKRGTADWAPASNGMKIGSGDQINTGIDGKATLNFENSTTEIKPLTQFTVGRAMESDKEYTTELFMSVGKIVSKANKIGEKSNSFKVTTPSAVAGIRGTQQEVSFGEGFGTECKIEDGVGFMAPSDPNNLPPAVQMCLGAGAAAEKAAEKAEKADKSADKPSGGAPEPKPEAPSSAPGAEGQGPGPGAMVSEAATSSAGEGGAAVSEAVSAALDQWLEASFDNVVVGEDDAAAPTGDEGGAAEAPEASAPEEAPSEGSIMELFDEAALEEASIEISDGEEASIEDALDIESIVEPSENLLDDAITDILPAGTPDAVADAAQTSTDISDEAPSEAVLDEILSDDFLNDILDEDQIQSGGDSGSSGSPEETDLFGKPPAHP